MSTEFGHLPIGFHVTLYYLIISVIGLLYFVYIKKDKFSIFLFLIFFGGTFSYWGEVLDNIFKISLLVFAFLLFLDTKHKLLIDIKVVIIFILFSVTFWLSIYFNGNPILYSLSHFSKFVVPFLLSFYIFNEITTIEKNLYYLNFILKLIFLQVLFSIIKFFSIGLSEAYVGSVVTLGGNAATFLPILGLLIIYGIYDGRIKTREAIFLGLMLLISIMSFKRIIWFIYPIVLLSLNFIWGRTKYLKYAVLLTPIIFYLGVRINPSLNKEKKIWGSFDLIYTIDYAMDYSGIQRVQEQGDIFIGRFAGNVQMLKYISNNFNQAKTWFGYGPKAIYGTSYEEYQRINWPWNVKHKGSLTGAARFLIAYGILGIFLYLSLFSVIIYQCENKKFKIFIILLFIIEFLFYLDTLILSFLMIPLLVLSNYLTLKIKQNYLKFLTDLKKHRTTFDENHNTEIVLP